MQDVIICPSVSRCVHSGTVAIFQPLRSCVWPEGLRFELERNLFSSSRHRRILLPSASSPSPERLSGRKAVRHVTKQRRENFLELVCKIQTLARSLWWLLVRSLFGSVSRQRQFSSVNFDLLFFNSLIMVMMWILHFLITWLTSLTWISNINIFFTAKLGLRHVHVPETMFIHALHFVFLKLLKLLPISCGKPLKRFILRHNLEVFNVLM